MLFYMLNDIEKLGVLVYFAPASYAPLNKGLGFFYTGFAAQ